MLEVEPRKKARAVHALSHLVYAHLQLYGILLAGLQSSSGQTSLYCSPAVETFEKPIRGW